jgi:hypothetical protein
LNNIRSLIKLFDGIIYKEHFIMLPGDEIVEKKHKNVRHLMAMAQDQDLSKRPRRKFPGLGAPIFKVDFEKQFAHMYGSMGQDGEDGRASQMLDSRPDSAAGVPEVEENEINTEVEV